MRSASLVAAMLVLATFAVAESPFAGTWKENRDKQQYDSEPTLEIQAEGNGIRCSNSVYAFVGPLDGSELQDLNLKDSVFTLKKSGERGFEMTWKYKGKPMSRSVVEVSPDGKTFTRSNTDLMPRKDGKEPTSVDTYNRIGGEGKPFPFVGTWRKDRKLRLSKETALMVMNEDGGVLTMGDSVSDTRTIIDLNKSEVTFTGPVTPPQEITYTVKKLAERSFELITLKKGRLFSTELYVVSEDGNTMAERMTTVLENGKLTTSTSIYDRQ